MAQGLRFRWVAALPILVLGAVDCYATGDGTAPPLDRFYFPVGLAVSNGGSVLYAANSNFDLQFNGGTLQSYDLRLIRRHVLDVIEDPRSPNVPLVRRGSDLDNPCPGDPPSLREDGSGSRQALGETCAPPVDSRFYFRDAAVIGAFATELLLSKPPDRLVPQASRIPGQPEIVGTRRYDRLFVPVRGNATLTWATVERDAPEWVAPEDPTAFYGPFVLDCGQGANRRCDGEHLVGADPRARGNTRGITMPGEPFGAAMSQDGRSIVVTHQSETKTSLFSTGLAREQNEGDEIPPPALQFILEGVPFGGAGVAAVPHDRDAFLPGEPFPRTAFLETSRAVAEVSLLRQYPDELGGVPSSNQRPFLDLEATFPITVSPGGTDSRGIAIDPTPRLECKARVAPADPLSGRTQEDVDAELLTCARKPARVFIANRSPASLLVGELGSAAAGGAYDPERLTLFDTVPLSAGPSRVYLAPIVDQDGRYALRVFVVCFDSATVFVYDPDAGRLENTIRTGPGPFAMAFDPFTLEDVATHAVVPPDAREPGRGLRRYRFAYIASFTQSFVQVLDLDNAQPRRETFERVVFTLGEPTNPKGT